MRIGRDTRDFLNLVASKWPEMEVEVDCIYCNDQRSWELYILLIYSRMIRIDDAVFENVVYNKFCGDLAIKFILSQLLQLILPKYYMSLLGHHRNYDVLAVLF